MKKIAAAALAVLLSATMFCGCDLNSNKENNQGGTPDDTHVTNPDDSEQPDKDNDDNKDKDNNDNTDKDSTDKEDDVGGGSTDVTEPEKIDWLATGQGQTNLSADGYVRGKIGDFSQYVGNAEAYKVVTTPAEFLSALEGAKYHYKNVWDDETKTYTQVAADGYTDADIEGKVHVIEIANDLDLGYNKIPAAYKSSMTYVENFNRKAAANETAFTMSDMFLESGISQIKIENTSNLLVFSKNGAKITHAGIKLTSDNNVVFRNLEFDEMWQWEDSSKTSTSAVGDYDAFGWAYFKIGFCGYVWIDHCTFGKSYDGQIDYSNPVYNAKGTSFRAPYGADGNNGLHISFCKFNAGSDDKDGYLYKMMEKIEKDYQDGGTNYLYYNALRKKFSFDEILYGLAIPQKKGFLCGDDAKFSGSYDNDDDYNFNLKLQISFANCVFKNIEDRLPKLRGGNAYMYNCIVDSSQYYRYRTILKNGDAADLVTKVSSTWKCGLVSQGIVCGNGGSVMAENCVFKGIDSLLKNNDKKNSDEYLMGGYNIVNCSYKKSDMSKPVVGSSSSSDIVFTNATSSTLTTDKFAWHTEGGTKPFEPSAIDLKELEEILNGKYGAGVNSELKDKYLQSEYKTNN